MQFLKTRTLLICLIVCSCYSALYSQNSEFKADAIRVPITTLDLDSFSAVRINALVGKYYAPGTVLVNSTGIPLDMLKSKIVFIHTWFAACAPCVAEFDALNTLYDSLRTQKQFLYLSFTFDDQKTIAQVREKYNIKYPIFHVDRNTCDSINYFCGYPANILLNSGLLFQKLYATPVKNISDFIKFNVATDIKSIIKQQ